MTWLGLASAVAAGNAAAPLVGFIVRAIGLIVLVLIGGVGVSLSIAHAATATKKLRRYRSFRVQSVSTASRALE